MVDILYKQKKLVKRYNYIISRNHGASHDEKRSAYN